MTPRWLIVLFVVWFAQPQSVTGQNPSVRPESTAVASSPTATRQLGTILELAARDNWSRVIVLLEDLQTSHGDDLIEVDPRRLLRGGLVAQVLLAQLPVRVVAEHQPGRDQALAAAIQAARETDDDEPRRRTLDRAAGSELAAELVNDLAEQAWRAGRLDSAASWWSRLRANEDERPLDPTGRLVYRSSRLTTADLAAREVLVESLRGDALRSAELLADFARMHPDATGALAGREGKLVDILRGETASQSQSVRAVDAGDLELQRDNLAGSVEIGGPLWRRPIDPPPADRELENRPPTARSSQPPSLPMAIENRIFWSSEQAIRGVQPDGQPIWPLGIDASDNSLYRTVEAGTPLELPIVGQVCRRMTSSAGRLFAMLGPAVAVSASREPRPIESRLVCLDVHSGEGKLLWTRTPEEVFPDPAWRWSGELVADGGQLLIAARRSQPGQGVALACLSAETGETLWFQFTASVLAESPAMWHLSASDTVVVDQHQVYLTSGAGLTAAFDRGSGRIQWVRRDEPRPWLPPPLTPTGEPARHAALLARGWLYTLPFDGRTVQCLETSTGATRWRQELPRAVDQLTGVRCGVLAVQGGQLWGLDQDTGLLRWRAGFDDVEGEFIGRGQLMGDRWLACSHEELWEVDLPTGEILQRHPLWAAYGIRGGHLLSIRDRLVIASEHELVALRRIGR